MSQCLLRACHCKVPLILSGTDRCIHITVLMGCLGQVVQSILVHSYADLFENPTGELGRVGLVNRQRSTP